ncbi:MAG: hypothetical protein HY304_07775 [candidate division Zixibacteria bacterium]|nr:hypothetical protein [candidate division Zixibacteria bacterium]
MTNKISLHQLINHSWHVPLKRAAELQALLAPHVRLTHLGQPPRVVAGVDSAQDGDHIFVAVVVMDIPEWKVIEIQCADGTARFPVPLS